MTSKEVKKGPKFGANRSMNESSAKFEIPLPKKVQELLKAEQGIAEKAVKTYAQEKNREFLNRVAVIASTARAMMGDEIPPELNLRLSDDFTKLEEV